MEAQSYAVFEKLKSDNDITQSIIYAVAQDKYGSIWLATEEGVVRNDSRDSYVYNKYYGLPEGVNNRILTVFIDSKQRIWIGTENGLCVYNAKEDKFRLVSAKSQTSSFIVSKIVEDNKGVIWISANNGLWKCSWNSEQYVLNEIVNPAFFSICAINSSILFSNANSLFLLNTLNNTTTKIEGFPVSTSSITTIKKIGQYVFIGTTNGKLYRTDVNFSGFAVVLSDARLNDFTIKDIVVYNKNYFVATDGGGVIVLDKNFKIIKQYLHNEDDIDSISSDGVHDLFVDKQNILWIATYGGELNYINSLKNNFTVIKHQTRNTNSLSNNLCRSFLDVGNNTVWFGTKNGINIWNRNINSWKHLKNIGNSSTGEIILTMALDGDYVWAGTYYSGLFKINKNTLALEHYGDTEPIQRNIPIKKVFKVYIDKQNNKWIGGVNGNLTEIKANGQIKVYGINQIRDIIQAKNGDIITVGKNGVFRISTAGVLSEIINLRAKKGSLEYVTLNSVLETKEGKLLIGSNGAGIIIYDIQTKKISTITSDSDLPSDIVQGIIEHSPDEYWVSTTKGIAKILISESLTTIVKYDKSDGLSSNEFNYNAYAKLNSGELIFGGLDGVTLFHPNKISTQAYLPQVVLEEFSLFNEIVKPGTKILESHINETELLNLKYSQNSIAFKFIGVLHGFSSKVKYTWKLEGFDENWSKPSSKIRVNYTNLSYGDYTFKVRASNKDGIWGQEKSVVISIARPWWASYLAYLIYVLIFGGLLYAVVYVTTLWQSKRNKEEQINTLNNITHEIKTPLSILIASLENETDVSNKSEIKSNIKRLNSLIGQMLNFHIVTSDNDIPVEISKIRIDEYFLDITNHFNPLLSEKKLDIVINNSFEKEIFYFEKEDLDKIMFNLISNAIKYSKENGKITVAISYNKKENLIIEISDNGIGIPKDEQKYILNNYYRARNVANSKYSGTGLGLMIVKNLVEKSKGKISFESKEDMGTTFRVELPNQESSYLLSAIKKDDATAVSFDVSELERFNNCKILIVEDNDTIRRNMVQFLENYFLIYEATNGKEGLDMALQIFPDLILTDYIMPLMDGVEMCNAIKDDINLNHIPVFMMTVLHSSSHEQKSIESGITEYFEKPININILLAKINNLFSWQEKLKGKYMHQGDVDNAEKFKTKKDADFIEKLELIVLDKIRDEEFTLQDICNKIGMSRTSLYMKLKSLIDLSPQDFIIHTKLKYAKRLLVEGDINIKEVAYSAGFANPKYFSTSFKKQFGMTPTEFVSSLGRE
ncbi:ATP-binding protein [Flavobacterium nackdongense]|uniref:histidine kinase n=1 Tax=Flavobacterium nackdongense TaxID=2547394 RepID=A0A4P6YIV8_9FLAO|nr:ATP-binding protein [Flavobacterium nackdongense]QBN20443.1 response regulator [Flavobacterium nackdongense]